MNNSQKLTNSSDEELAAQAAAGSRACFEELVCRFSPRLFHFLRHKTQSDQDSEDIIQETFIKVYHNIDRYNPEWKFSTWLFTAANRLAISRLRYLKVRRDSYMTHNPPSGPEEAFILNEEARHLWDQAQTLPKRQHEALWLRYIEGMSLNEIAEVLHIKQVHARVLLHRARLNLERKLNSAAAKENFCSAGNAEQNCISVNGR
jgi:RNA polymerase sigma-70 factor (ECF subfamily)